MKPIITLTFLLALSAASINAQDSFVQFRAVSPLATESTDTMTYSSGESALELHLVKEPIITNSQIASAEIDDNQPSVVMVTLTEEGEKRFDDGIKDMQGKQIAIVVNGRVVSAPVLQATSFGRILQISGNLSAAEAGDLANQLNKK